jgi:adenosylcobinamide-GDP ribazoletransferase
MALRQLTALPIRYVAAESTASPARALPWFPVVGVPVGLVVGGTLALPLPPLVRAALALAVWVGVTGALHEDGLMDCADAALAPVGRERRLEILKDPRVGAFGVAAEGLALLVRFAALASVPATAPLVVAVSARWSMTLTLSMWRPARTDGLGARFAHEARAAPPTAVALVLLAAASGIEGRAFDAGSTTLLAVGGALSAGLGTAAWLSRRFGGLTGDAHGAAAVTAECAGLLVYAGRYGGALVS